ncbi:putative tryptophanyl-tRNA synthetase [Rosellinia necatrix]|uniref:tryptophan--tRNA ligase n=1 Tax=Rosellinia necatrix TaxID=77044 RepID=A0A1W2TEP6_ROSNE|nr:putative tryptophanyl-tRNA synthetase [Rosellinia necatrix]
MLPIARSCYRRLPVPAARHAFAWAHRRRVLTTGEGKDSAGESINGANEGINTANEGINDASKSINGTSESINGTSESINGASGGSDVTSEGNDGIDKGGEDTGKGGEGGEGDEGTGENDAAVVFSGIQPTGIPHLGNYLGALRQWKQLQDVAGDKDKLFFSIVDLHALTSQISGEHLRNRRRELLASLLAIGLDPQRSTIFYQSSVPQHSELMWILSCTASMGYLSRMTQFKAKIIADNKSERNLDKLMQSTAKLGLFSYPVLQAADILVHRATHVPVGDDQRQHLEFARECVTNFNHHYKAKIFTPPKTITAPISRVMSLTHPLEKMSKSARRERSRILITSLPEEIERRIMAAETDMYNEVTYEPQDRPGVTNLLEITAQCSPHALGWTAADVADHLSGGSLRDLKELCAKSVNREFRGIRERYEELLAHEGGRYLDDVADAGADVARESAEETMKAVREIAGLVPLRDGKSS